MSRYRFRWLLLDPLVTKDLSSFVETHRPLCNWRPVQRRRDTSTLLKLKTCPALSRHQPSWLYSAQKADRGPTDPARSRHRPLDFIRLKRLTEDRPRGVEIPLLFTVPDPAGEDRWPSEERPARRAGGWGRLDAGPMLQDRSSNSSSSQTRVRGWRSGCRVCSCTMEMFSMLKHTIISDNVNPINSYFELGRQTGSAGPEMVWKVYEAVRKEDKKVSI